MKKRFNTTGVCGARKHYRVSKLENNLSKMDGYNFKREFKEEKVIIEGKPIQEF